MVIDCQGREAMRKISSANEEEEWYLRRMENELEGLKEATFHDLEEQAKKKIMSGEYSWRKKSYVLCWFIEKQNYAPMVIFTSFC